MSQSIITTAFERWKAQESIDGNLIVLDEFVFAHIPNLELEKPIDRNEGLPDAKYIVHRQTVNKTGVVNQNAVAYSVTMGADIGDFDFNWIGLLNKKSGTVAMIVHAPTQRKIKTQAGQQGNVLTRSFLLEYLGASKETAINTPAEMWQIDFTARLTGIDEMQRLINRDKYGVASFFSNGFLVAKAGNQFYITKGLGYIEGLRAELTENKNITISNQATKVWVDVSYQGNITSDWNVHIAITVKPDLKNYVDNAGFPHFVFAVASISATGVITDLRPKGTLDAQYFDDALKQHEQSRNHPDATTTEKGFTKLDNQVGSSQTTALTPLGAQNALENYQPKGNYQPAGNYVTTATFNLEINKKIDKESISQQLVNDVNKVPSLDLLTKELGKKQAVGNYADKSTSTTQSFNAPIVSNKDILSISENVKIGLKAGDKDATLIMDLGNGWKIIKLQDKAGTLALVGDSYLKSESDFQLNELKNNVYSKSSTDNFLNKKIDKSSVSQQLANDVNKVPSLDLVTKELGKKQAVGNYADKSSVGSQVFSGTVSATGSINAQASNGDSVGLFINDGDPFISAYINGRWTTQVKLPDKNGVMALRGDSYTKSESDSRYPLKTDVYSKLATDSKYGLKNTSSKLDNGWWKCGDTGLIYQFGVVSGCVNRDESRAFTIPFPNKCLSIIGGYLNEDEWGQGISMRVIDNKTFFSVVRSASGLWASARAYYIAIGY
jgi:hypothetical protein